MAAIKGDVVRNIRIILSTYEDITSYVVENWSMGRVAATRIEEWYWRVH